VEVNKNLQNLDKAMEALVMASKSGEFKGEDLDQLNAVANAVKALRIRVYGTEEAEPVKKEQETADIQKSVAPENDALQSVISQLQEVAKNVTEQAAAAKAAVEEINTVKADVTKAVEEITGMVSKIPVRNSQNPEAESADRTVQKSLIETVKERAGGDDMYKSMHPAAKLRLMFDTKLNSK
jgi:hypothetical protein